eukprot:gene25807-31166_t
METQQEAPINLEYQECLADYLNIHKRLRAVGLNVGIHIPQIVVLGTQQAGKSTVLEALTGFPFTQRPGAVTKLKMRKLPPGGHRTYELSMLGDNNIWIRRNIANQEDMNQAIKDASNFDTISVKICDPNVPDLTFVDLPAWTADDDGAVEEPVLQYLRDRRSIILAVIPADGDLDALATIHKALQYDGLGDRTVGVITKAGKVPNGAEDDVLNLLRNIMQPPLQLGYIMANALSNGREEGREQAVEDSDNPRREEARPLVNEGIVEFSQQRPELFGMRNLSKRILEVLSHRAEQQLATVKPRVDKALTDCSRDLAVIGVDPPRTATEAVVLYSAITNEFIRTISSSIKGDYYASQLLLVPNNDRVRIEATFRGIFIRYTDVNLFVNPFNTASFRKQLVDLMGRRTVRNLPGTYDYGLLMTCVRQAFVDWKTCGENCLNEVKAALQTAVFDILQQSLKYFPRLLAMALSEAHRVIGTLAASTLGIVDEQFRLETEELFTQDGAFYLQVRVQHGIAAWRGFLNQTDLVTAENIQNWVETYFANGDIDYMQACLSDYWAKVRARLADAVPRAILKSFVDKLPDELTKVLTAKMGQDLQPLFVETGGAQQRRRALRERAQHLSALADDLAHYWSVADEGPWDRDNGDAEEVPFVPFDDGGDFPDARQNRTDDHHDAVVVDRPLLLGNGNMW